MLVLDLVDRWSAQSQQVARRNAMLACTVLAARRQERLEVAEFLATFAAGQDEPGPRTAVI